MKKTVPFHPLLFVLFPALFLYSHNMLEYTLSVVVVPILATLILAMLCWITFGFVSRDISKAALMTSLFLLLFFSYGHVYDILWYFFSVRPFTFREGANFILKPLFGLLFLGGNVWIVWTRRDLSALTRWANIVSVILVAVPLLTMGMSALKTMTTPADGRQSEAGQRRADSAPSTAELPDIYYIILDAFGREDILNDIYEYHNSTLYAYLRQRGFFVGDKSGANYCQTMLSLSSSLNYKYLDPGEDRYDPDSKDRGPLDQMVLNSRLVKFLRERGYTTVAFASGSPATEMRNADVFLEPASKIGFVDEFQSGLINTTALPFFLSSTSPIPFFGRNISHLQAEARRDMILRTFDLLGNMPQRTSPKFVFAHLVTPHPPFIFGPNGEPRDPPIAWSLADGNWLIGRLETRHKGYIWLYRDQLQFIEKKIIAAIESILTHSVRPPIIVLQSDHGPGAYLHWNDSDKTNMRERLSILNAYYLPDGGDTVLYETITPVNTFRAILNQYFDQRLDLLPDESYYSLWDKPYYFIPVSPAVKGDSGAPAMEF